MSRYILDINSDIAKSIVVFGMMGDKGVFTVFKIDELEELNSDYINENYGQLQDDAYQRGQIELIVAIRELIKHDNSNDWKEMGFKFDSSAWSYRLTEILRNYEPSEIIEKNNTYKQDDKIVVGDEVERYLNGEFDSKGIYLGDIDEGVYCKCLFWTGVTFSTLAYPKEQFKKTGRHFDIQSILEAMKT